jgi:hypothetical protein
MAAKTETPDKKKTNLSKSDQSTRSKHAEEREQERENWNEITDVVTPLQTSEGRQAQSVSAAFGSEDEESRTRNKKTARIRIIRRSYRTDPARPSTSGPGHIRP